jgi:hypothetical protein
MFYGTNVSDRGAPKGGGGATRLQPLQAPQNWNLKNTDFVHTMIKGFTWFTLQPKSAT